MLNTLGSTEKHFLKHPHRNLYTAAHPMCFQPPRSRCCPGAARRPPPWTGPASPCRPGRSSSSPQTSCWSRRGRPAAGPSEGPTSCAEKQDGVQTVTEGWLTNNLHTSLLHIPLTPFDISIYCHLLSFIFSASPISFLPPDHSPLLLPSLALYLPLYLFSSLCASLLWRSGQ